jgi:hypothetical protein
MQLPPGIADGADHTIPCAVLRPRTPILDGAASQEGELLALVKLLFQSPRTVRRLNISAEDGVTSEQPIDPEVTIPR